MSLSQVLSLTIVLPVVVGTILLRRIPYYSRFFVAFLYFGLLTEIASIAYAYLYGNNMVVFYFFVSFASLALGIAYGQVIGFKYASVLFLVPLSAVVEGLLSGARIFNSISFTVFNFSVIFVTLVAFFRMIKGEVREAFLFNGSLLFYALGSAVFYFTAMFLQETDLELMGKMFGLHFWINAITNVAFAYSLWILYKSYSSARRSSQH